MSMRKLIPVAVPMAAALAVSAAGTPERGRPPNPAGPSARPRP